MQPAGRPPKQQDAILSHLRKLAWRRGERLPSVRQLAQQFHASTRTVQRALHHLKRDGLVCGRAGVATFMTANEPVPARYALVVPKDPADLGTLWSRFYASLVNESPAVARAAHCEIVPFYGLDNGPRAADYARLANWCATGSIAGIIFATHPYHLIGTPILEQPGISRVALMGGQPLPNVPVVALQGSFFAKAFAWLAGRGRRKLAVLMQTDQLREHDLVRQAAGYGLELRPAWQLPMKPDLLEAGAAYVRLLMAATESNRPDALLVGDDNYVESVLEGLGTTSARLGSDLDLVAHCNFPWAGALPPQVQKLGYSAHEALETCLQLLDRQRAGGLVPAVTTIAAKFEEEVERQPIGAALETAAVTKR